MTLKTVAEHRCFGGIQGVWQHASDSTATDMTFAVYLPPQAQDGPVPVLLYLSGLTCTWENVTVKAGAQRTCAEHGLALVAPDTSPRGTDLPGEHEAYDFGSGAGFYVDATEAPWSAHYRMASYIATDLPAVLAGAFPQLDMDRVGITGHSMGGHGALVTALRAPGAYKSVSAFAPICAPGQVPWGRKALGGYLGADETAWRAWDACALIADGRRVPELLVDQGEADEFLDSQLRPDLLEAACERAGIALQLRRHAGYDHSYYFIASVIGDHVAWHAQRLKGEG